MTSSDMQDTPAGRRADGPDGPRSSQPRRRTFTAAYKLAMIEKYDAATGPGAKGALLRGEGLYDSHISYWRKAGFQVAEIVSRWWPPVMTVSLAAWSGLTVMSWSRCRCSCGICWRPGSRRRRCGRMRSTCCGGGGSWTRWMSPGTVWGSRVCPERKEGPM